ncbi:MAG: helix-turn-helix transcriptional regulator [Planctomycetes bacterium]|nr:helix-turn-helix transcriptional regulator [Planctomycetota bacterium]
MTTTKRMDSATEQSGFLLHDWIQDSEKWTQRSLAEAVGVNESTISRWMNGARAPSREVVAKIAKITRLDLPIKCPVCGAVS